MPTPILPEGTLLVLTPLSGNTALTLTPYAARGLTQKLEVIDGPGAQIRRDVNGFMRNLSDSRFRKYRSTISCRDGETPCLDDAWIGEIVDVSCAVELNFPTGALPQRPAVVGSVRTQAGFTFYRPLLTMMVASITNDFQEYAAINGWSITLEEV